MNISWSLVVIRGWIIVLASHFIYKYEYHIKLSLQYHRWVICWKIHLCESIKVGHFYNLNISWNTVVTLDRIIVLASRFIYKYEFQIKLSLQSHRWVIFGKIPLGESIKVGHFHNLKISWNTVVTLDQILVLASRFIYKYEYQIKL